jgi:hypothetical protein
MLTIRRRSNSTSFAPTSFLLLMVNVFIKIFNSHFPKAPYPFDPTLDCQASDCKPDMLLVADHLVKILTCDLAASVFYNSIDPVYETARAITSQFKLLNRRHSSYLDFYYKTGKTEFSI